MSITDTHWQIPMFQPTAAAAQPDGTEELRRLLRHHDRLYHHEQLPAITDAEYDTLKTRLRAAERKQQEPPPPDSPTQTVGHLPANDFQRVPHPEPMLSLGNVYDADEFAAWHRRTAANINTNSFVMTAELKIDGLACRLRYRGGALDLAATRGDGQTGENVTHTVRTVQALPHVLPEHAPQDLDLRGEIYLPVSRFERLNDEREAAGLYRYANPRNAAAGAVRQHDPAEAARRGLRFWAYSFNRAGDTQAPDSHYAALNVIRDCAIPVNPCRRLCRTVDEVADFYRQMLTDREQQDYQVDGIVVKVDDTAQQASLGSTGHEPRWAIAWKFPADRVVTRLTAIDISIGRFGKLTPVATLDPVAIGGVTVQSASLHNADYVAQRDLRPGDLVTLERAGDVIPQVLGPVDDDRHDRHPAWHMPAQCPRCKEPVVHQEDEAAHWCVNRACPSRLSEVLKHFTGKRAMDIDGLGEHWCQALVDAGLVTDVSDLYGLRKGQLLELSRMGARRADQLLANIAASKRQTLDRVLYGLGIYRLGREVSTLLADRYDSVESVSRLTADELTAIEGIGPKVAESLVEAFASESVQRTIAGLTAAGVRMEQESNTIPFATRPETQNDTDLLPWQGLNFVVTGKLDGMSRNDAEVAIRQLGGRTGSAVSGKTNFLVVGQKPGNKLDKARQLNVSVLDDSVFAELLAAPARIAEMAG